MGYGVHLRLERVEMSTKHHPLASLIEVSNFHFFHSRPPHRAHWLPINLTSDTLVKSDKKVDIRNVPYYKLVTYSLKNS